MTAPAVAMAAVTALRPLRGGTPNNTSAGHTLITAPIPARAPRPHGEPATYRAATANSVANMSKRPSATGPSSAIPASQHQQPSHEPRLIAMSTSSTVISRSHSNSISRNESR